jgi:hypothetical protein
VSDPAKSILTMLSWITQPQFCRQRGSKAE